MRRASWCLEIKRGSRILNFIGGKRVFGLQNMKLCSPQHLRLHIKLISNHLKLSHLKFLSFFCITRFPCDCYLIVAITLPHQFYSLLWFMLAAVDFCCVNYIYVCVRYNLLQTKRVNWTSHNDVYNLITFLNNRILSTVFNYKSINQIIYFIPPNFQLNTYFLYKARYSTNLKRIFPNWFLSL